MTNRVNVLLQQLDASRQRMLETLAEFDDDMLVHEEQIWRVQDVLAHLNVSEREHTNALDAYINGDDYTMPWFEPGVDVSDQIYQKYKAYPAEQIHDMWEAARERLLATVNKLTDDDLDNEMIFPWKPQGLVHEIIEFVAWHEEHHRSAIVASARPAEHKD